MSQKGCFPQWLSDFSRDIYYNDVALFECQKNSDEAVENVAIMLQVPRSSLQIVASYKGAIAGCITYKEKSRLVDCAKSGLEGVAITPFVDDIKDIQTSAKYVLLIEKDTTFMRRKIKQ
jgi:meiotic recombination protein SPO11